MHIEDYLKTDTFTIVGTMYTPVYLSYEKGSTTVGSGSIDNFITILDEDFNMDYYTQVNLTVEGAKALNSYEDAYFDVTDPVKNRLESLGLERADLRLEDIRANKPSRRMMKANRNIRMHKRSSISRSATLRTS